MSGGLLNLNGIDLHNPFFKIFVGNDGFVFDLAFIRIYGIDRISEYAGNFLGIMNSHPDKRKYPEIGIQQFSFF